MKAPVADGPRAATSRTRTSSHSCASTSSFPSSGFSRRKQEEKSWLIHLSQKSECSPSTSPPKAGRSATGKYTPLAEHGAVLAARHHLRRRWQVELRACRTSRDSHADSAGPGSGPFSTRPGRDGGSGSPTVTLLQSEMPVHTHFVHGLQPGPTFSPRGQRQ